MESNEYEDVMRFASPYIRDINNLLQNPPKSSLFYLPNSFDLSYPSVNMHKNLIKLSRSISCSNVLQIGFEHGYETILILLANDKTVVHLVDVVGGCENKCLMYLKDKFPERVIHHPLHLASALYHCKGNPYGLFYLSPERYSARELLLSVSIFDISTRIPTVILTRTNVKENAIAWKEFVENEIIKPVDVLNTHFSGEDVGCGYGKMIL